MTVPIGAMMEVITAAHLTRYVVSPFRSRGGVLFVGPPGVLKSSLLSVLDAYPDALLLSDLNAQALTHLRESITSGSIQTIAISDLQKVYERHANVAANVEGSIRALVEEGYRGAGFEDSRINRLQARCMFMGGLTQSFAEQRFTNWLQSGFLRRFLYVLYRLENPSILADAVEEWQLVDIGVSSIPAPAGSLKSIPSTLTNANRRLLRVMLKHQYGDTLPFQLYCKIGDVLAWHYQRMGIRKRALDTLECFSACLSKEGAEVSIPTTVKGRLNNGKRKK